MLSCFRRVTLKLMVSETQHHVESASELPYPLFFFPFPFTLFLLFRSGGGGGAMEADSAKAICVSSSRSLRRKRQSFDQIDQNITNKSL